MNNILKGMTIMRIMNFNTRLAFRNLYTMAMFTDKLTEKQTKKA